MKSEHLENWTEIELPEPVRQLKRSRSGAQISLFHSRKNQRLWNLESSIELDYAHFLEWSPTVLRFVPQPLEVFFVQQGKRKSYVPDFMHVSSDMQRVVTEIKPEGWDESPFLREKFELVDRALALQGIRFYVVTDRDLRSGFLLQNLRYLYPYYLSVQRSELRSLVIALTRMAGTATVRDLLATDPNLSFSALAGYAYENWLEIESSLFDYSTTLSLEG